jgi:hypothetical protein
MIIPSANFLVGGLFWKFHAEAQREIKRYNYIKDKGRVKLNEVK